MPKYWVHVSWLERTYQRFAAVGDDEKEALEQIKRIWGEEDGFQVDQVTYEGD